MVEFVTNFDDINYDYEFVGYVGLASTSVCKMNFGVVPTPCACFSYMHKYVASWTKTYKVICDSNPMQGEYNEHLSIS